MSDNKPLLQRALEDLDGVVIKLGDASANYVGLKELLAVRTRGECNGDEQLSVIVQLPNGQKILSHTVRLVEDEAGMLLVDSMNTVAQEIMQLWQTASEITLLVSNHCKAIRARAQVPTQSELAEDAIG